jgi:hypothetical protein
MFHFTIRELLLVTVIVAMGVGWWLEHRRSAGLKRLLDVVEIEAKQSRMAINTMYADLDRNRAVPSATRPDSFVVKRFATISTIGASEVALLNYF